MLEQLILLARHVIVHVSLVLMQEFPVVRVVPADITSPQLRLELVPLVI